MSYPTGPVGPPPSPQQPLPSPPWAAGPVPPQAWPGQAPPYGPPGQMPYAPPGQMPPYGPPGQVPYAPPGQVPYGQAWPGGPVPPRPAAAPGPGRPPAWPLRVWRSWSETRRALTAIAVAAVAAGGLYGLNKLIDAYDAKHPDYTYSVLGCAGRDGKVTVDFTLTSKMQFAQDAQLDVEYFDQSGKQLGDDWIDVPGIEPHQTIRKSYTSNLKAAAEVTTCKFDHDVISRDPS